MKELIGALIFLALTFYVGTELYERAKDKDWLSAPTSGSEVDIVTVPKPPPVKDWEAPSYPAKLELYNKDGRGLRLNLLGRDSTHIYFLRFEDDREFSYSIEDLDEASRRKVRAFPESKLDDKQNLKLHALHVQNLENKMRLIDERMSAVDKEYRISNSQTERRTLMREFEELEQEYLALENEIEEYQ